jgi:hypothetical protein
MNTKCTKGALKIPNVHKIFQMAINTSTFSNLRPSKIYPNWDIWSENKPSGNPAPDVSRRIGTRAFGMNLGQRS